MVKQRLTCPTRQSIRALRDEAAQRWSPPRGASSFFAYAILRLAIFLIAVSFPARALADSTEPIRMRVVESGTNKPVAGANVRYFARVWEGTFTGHGGRTATMFEIRGESDFEGNIALPATQFSPRIFGILGFDTNYENAAMSITKSGYLPLELRNSLRIMPNLDEVITWEYKGRTVELQPVRNAAGALPVISPDLAPQAAQRQ